MLKDAATLSWLGLVKEVLPSKDSCWLASANGVVASLSRAERRYRLLSCPESAAAAVGQLGAALAAGQLGAALAAEQLEQPAA